MSRSIASSLALLGLAGLCAAAPIAGRVVAVDGTPLEGANLRVAGTRLGVATDVDGRFRLELPDEGGGQLVISHLGYASLRVPANPGTEIVLRLEPSLVEGAPVTVEAARAADGSPVTHHNIPREELRRRHAGQDLALLLDGTPGLVTTSYGGGDVGYSEIRLRGFDQKRVEVLVNGVLLNDPEDHYVYWVDLPDMGSSLEDVQIQRGPGTGHVGGSNFGGSVNLVTGLSERPGLQLEAGRGSLDSRRYSLGWGSGIVDGRWQMDARWSRVISEGWREASGSDQWGYLISARRFFADGSLRINHYNGRELTHVSWDGIDETRLFGLDGWQADRRQNNDAAYANSVDDYYQPHFELIGDWRLPAGLALQATLFHVIGSGFYETLKTDRSLVDYSLAPWSEWLPDPDNSGAWIESAVESTDLVNRRWIDKRQTGLNLLLSGEALGTALSFGLQGYVYDATHWGEVVWAERLAPGSEPGGRYYTHETEKSRLAAVLAAERPLGDQLRLTGRLNLVRTVYSLRQLAEGGFQGALLNRFEDEHVFFNPSLGLSWKLQDGLSVYASAAVANREPSRGEYWNAWEGPDDLGVTPMFARADTLSDGSLQWSDPLIEPERMLDLELGAEWRSASAWLKANVYWMQMRNEIVNAGGVDEESPVKGNAPRSHHAGLEIDGRFRAAAALEVGGNLALSRNRIDELTVHDTAYDAEWTPSAVSRDFAGNPIALSPEIVANAWFEWAPAAWFSLRPTAQFVGEQYLDNSGDDDFSELAPELMEAGYADESGRLRFSKTLDAYAVFGLDARLQLERWLRQELELRLKVANLLDSEYETGGYWNDWTDADGDWAYEPQRSLYPAAGRHWWLTLALRL